jgi:N-acetylmuramoyl-L-alanine amidase
MPEKPALTQKLTHFINNTAIASQQLATTIQTNLLENLHTNGFKTRDRGVKKGMYRLLIRNSMPSVLVEIGFITNVKDALLLSNSNYQGCVAKGIVTGIKKILK